MDWANDNAICCENKQTNVFKYEERSASIVRVFLDGRVSSTLSSWAQIADNMTETPSLDNGGSIGLGTLVQDSWYLVHFDNLILMYILRTTQR
jgi:hypothetical protein